MEDKEIKARRFAALSVLVGEQLFSTAEAALILGMTPAGVAGLVRDGRLIGRRVGRAIAISERAIKRMVGVE